MSPNRRVLAIICGSTAETVVEGEQDSLGPLSELADLGETAELHIVRDPALEELPQLVQSWRPTLVYVSSGVPGPKAELHAQALPALPLLCDGNGGLLDSAMETLLSAFAGLPLEAVFLDFQGSGQLAERLLQACSAAPSSSEAGSGDGAAANGDGTDGTAPAGLRHVLCWAAGETPPVLPAWDFGCVFFGMLRTPGVSIPEAYAIASRAALAHSTEPPAGADMNNAGAVAAPAQPPLPQLLPAQPPASLPNCASVAAPAIEGADLAAGVAAAFPGYADLRLLAPNAELRLLLAGVSAMVNQHNLRPFGEALRGVLAAEARGLQVLSLTPFARPPPHLPAGSGAVRCEARTPNGASCSVTLGGPADLLGNKELVQYALRQAMTADAHTLQLKVPPPGCPPPPTHLSPGVACGAPVVEGLAATSIWCVQLLKVLAQDTAYRGLALLGVAAVSTSPVAAFGTADSARLSLVVTQNDLSKVQVPALPAAPEPTAPAAAAAANGVEEALPVANGTHPPPPLQQPAPSPLQQLQQLLSVGSPAAPPVAGTGAAAAAGATAGAAAAPGLQPAAGSTAALSDLLAGGSSLPDGGSAGTAAAAAAAAPLALQAAAPAEAMQVEEAKPPLALLLQQQALLQQQQLMQQQAAAAAAAGGTLPWKSNRPLLALCSEEQFYTDLIAFLTDRQGRQIDPLTFPEAILNGTKLDLFHLYREVTSRGGYKVGNGINWKGQVFPRMRNFTANNKMTGVGNALKRHYQHFLLEYEQAHLEDITGDRCGICGHGEEVAADWISCDMCDCWFHFSCDVRQARGTFKDYAKGKGRIYHCPRCSEVRRHQQMQAATAAQLAAAQAAAQVQAAGATGGGVQQQEQQQGQQQAQQQQQAGPVEGVLPPQAAAAAAMAALAMALQGDGPAPMQDRGLLALLQRPAKAAVDAAARTAARAGSSALQLPEPLRLFLVSSTEHNSDAPSLLAVEEAVQGLLRQVPGLKVELLDSAGAGGDASVDAGTLVVCQSGGKAGLRLRFQQGGQCVCIELPATLKRISLGRELREHLAVTGMAASEAARSKLQFKLQLSGPLGSEFTRVTARLGGFGDERLDRQRKSVGVSKDRKTVTFDAPSGMARQELDSLAGAVAAGRLAPTVESWLEKAPAPTASALVLEVRPSEAAVSVRSADGRAVQLSAAAAEQVKEQLWRHLAQLRLPLPAASSSAAQGGAADMLQRVQQLEQRCEAAQVVEEGLTEDVDTRLGVIEEVLLGHSQLLQQHSSELARQGRGPALAAQQAAQWVPGQAQQAHQGDADMAEASRKRARSSEQHDGPQQEGTGQQQAQQAQPPLRQLAGLASKLRYLHLSRRLAAQTQHMPTCSTEQLAQASASAPYLLPQGLPRVLDAAAAAVSGHYGLQPSSPLQLPPTVLASIVCTVLHDHNLSTVGMQQECDSWLAAEQLCRRVCARSKASLPSLLLLSEQPAQEQAAIRKKADTSDAAAPEAASPALWARAALEVLKVVPAMAAAAATVAADDRPPQQALYEQYQFVILCTAEAPPVGTPGQLLDWLAAADALLRLIPLPAALAAEQAAGPHALGEAAGQLMKRCLGVFSQASAYALHFLQGQDQHALQALAAKALPAAVALHSRACRFVHWACAGGPGRAQAVSSGLPGGWPALAHRLSCAFTAAALLVGAAEEGGQVVPGRTLGLDSLSAAHLVAMAALVPHAGDGALVQKDVVAAVASAASSAPALALSSPAWQALRTALHRGLQLPKLGFHDRALSVAALLAPPEGRSGTPWVAADLLACGLLGAVAHPVQQNLKWYCGEACSHPDWRQHKLSCRLLLDDREERRAHGAAGGSARGTHTLERAYAFEAVPSLGADPLGLALQTFVVHPAIAVLLQAAAAPMAALERPLAAQLRAAHVPHAALRLYNAAANVVLGGSILASKLGLPAQTVAAVAGAGCLVVGAGAALMESTAAPAFREGMRGMYIDQDAQRTVAARTAIRMLEAAANLHSMRCTSSAHWALAGDAFAPRRVLPLLRAVADLLAAIEDDPADDITRAYTAVAHLLGMLLIHPRLNRLQAAIKSNRALTQRLLPLLLRCLATSAACEGSGGAGDDGEALQRQLRLGAGTASALVAPPVVKELMRFMRGSDSDAALAPIRHAAAVLRRLPLQPDAVLQAQQLWNAHYHTSALLSYLLRMLPGRPAGPPPPPSVPRPPAVRHAALVAIHTVPVLAAATVALPRPNFSLADQPPELLAMAGLGPEAIEPSILGATLQLHLFEHWQEIFLATADAPPMAVRSDLLDWQAAADAALRMIGVPAALAAELAAQPGVQLHGARPELATQLAQRCFGVASQACTQSPIFLETLSTEQRRQLAPEAAPAAAALHSRYCRLIHWASAGGPQRFELVGTGLSSGWPSYATRLSSAFLTLTHHAHRSSCSYRGPACSRADWRQHKLSCPVLKAAREAQSAAQSGIQSEPEGSEPARKASRQQRELAKPGGSGSERRSTVCFDTVDGKMLIMM
ncbi:hypothetical protein ABPG75_008690 [Micractinium tetrahymenae]